MLEQPFTPQSVSPQRRPWRLAPWLVFREVRGHFRGQTLRVAADGGPNLLELGEERVSAESRKCGGVKRAKPHVGLPGFRFGGGGQTSQTVKPSNVGLLGFQVFFSMPGSSQGLVKNSWGGSAMFPDFDSRLGSQIEYHARVWLPGFKRAFHVGFSHVGAVHVFFCSMFEFR